MDIFVRNVDVDLLRDQRNFLLEYAWRETSFPQEVDGIINLLDNMLDIAEGFVSPNQLVLEF